MVKRQILKAKIIGKFIFKFSKEEKSKVLPELILRLSLMDGID